MNAPPDNIDAVIDQLGLGTLARDLVTLLKNTEKPGWDAALRAKLVALTNSAITSLRNAAD